MSMATLMNTTVAIQTESGSKSSSGFISRTWNTTTASMPARVEDMDEDAMVVYGRLGLSVTDLIFFATNPNLTGFENTKRISWNGNFYYPKQVRNPGGNINRLWQVVCLRDKT